MIRTLSFALLCAFSVVTTGCLFFSSAVDDAGTNDGGSDDGGTTDSGVVDAGEDAGIVDAGLDAGTADAGLDAGTIDAGTIDAGGVDGGTIDAGDVDAGDVDAGDVDAGTVDGGETFADDPYPDQPHRLRLRILAMNIDDEETDFPLIVRIPPTFLTGTGVAPENVRVFTSTEGQSAPLPMHIESANEFDGVLLYALMPVVDAQSVDQGIFVYVGPQATSLSTTSGPVFDDERFVGVFPLRVGNPSDNLVTASPVGISGEFAIVPSDTGTGHLGSSPLMLTNFAETLDEEDGVSIGLAVRWPLENTISGTPFLTTGNLSLRRAGGSGRVRMYIDVPAEPITRSLSVFRSVSRIYAAVEARTVGASATVKIFGPEQDPTTLDSTLALDSVISPVTFGDLDWPTVIDEIRIGKVQFTPGYHALTSLNMTGHLVEVQSAPRPPPRVPALTGVAPIPPTYRWTFSDCSNGMCPSSGLRDNLILNVTGGTVDAGRGAFVYTAGEPATSMPPACDAMNTGITVGAWFSPDNLRSYGPARLVTLSTGAATQSFVLGQAMAGPDDAARFVIRDRQTAGTAVSFAHPSPIDVGASYFVGASIEHGGVVRLCVDDVCEVADFTSTLTGAVAAVNAKLRIGNESGGGRAAPGIYDEVSYWCEPLSEAELVDYYNSRLQ